MRDYNLTTNLEQLLAAAAVNAAGALSRLLNDEVQVRYSRVYYGDWREALLESFHGRGNLLALSQTAFGVETMTVSLVVEEDYVDRLLDMLMGRRGGFRAAVLDADAPDGERFLSCEIDALKEATNVVTCICMQALSGQLDPTGVSLPSVLPEMSLVDRVCWLLPDAQAICAKSRFRASALPLEIELTMSIVQPPESGASVSSSPATVLPGARRSGGPRARS